MLSTSSFVCNFDGFLAIDLTTTFGAGNEPTKEEMDTLIGLLEVGLMVKSLLHKTTSELVFKND